MKFVLAPDSFKGTLNQKRIAEIINDALKEVGHIGRLKPMSDGGDGLMHCFSSEGYQKIQVNVTGPEGKTVTADYYMDGETAIIETAEACGLHLITDSKPDERTSFGVGEMMFHAIDRGARKIIIGLGGSATNDGGYGMYMALGGMALDQNTQPLSVMNHEIPYITKLDDSAIRPLNDIHLIIASDVTNPLLGPNGAIATFGPQKGIDSEHIEYYEEMLLHLKEKISGLYSDVHSDTPGAGAAGGLGWMLLNLGAEITEGGGFIAKMIRLEEEIQDADAVITGEGKSDSQTMDGKVPAVVAMLAQKHDKPVYLISAQITEDLTDHFDRVCALTDYADSAEEVKRNPEAYLRHTIVSIFG
ncbi:glycerate kinase [Salinicoccus albus]|uniref:glycerate kinase n=1 Tax=Salinicoccus albus TaxID=418756 RepID=UPI00036D43FC|nr:glycerate kinase [Salinicoccus albus]